MDHKQKDGVLKEPQIWYHGNPSAEKEGFILTRTVVRVSPRFLWYYGSQWDPHQRRYVETTNILRAAREGWFPMKGEAYHDLIEKLSDDIAYRERALEEVKRKRDAVCAAKDAHYKETTPVYTKDTCESDGAFHD